MVNEVRVKICGLTRAVDALAALDAGADYLGFILYPPSPRAITPSKVAEVVAQLHQERRPLFAQPQPPQLVGVFVNESPADVADILQRCRLDLAQLSGNEAAESLTDPASPLFGRGYKAIRPADIATARSIAERYTKFDTGSDPTRPRLLLDTPHAHLFGGSGQTGDWAIAAALAAAVPGLMLAGGLNPDNVAQAVRQARPWAVDVAGGVESAPGIKDHVRLRAFIAHAKAA